MAKFKAVNPTFRANLTQCGFRPAGPKHVSAPEGLSNREAKSLANKVWEASREEFAERRGALGCEVLVTRWVESPVVELPSCLRKARA